ncbi:MAG: 3'-5' exonuclease [Rhodocyclaceae bacterium]|nr:3'-5' exonuclease [Rhodocyclaceae bacterium]
MNWLSRLLSNRTDPSNLDEGLRKALADWQSLPRPDLSRPHFETRYVVLNTEAGGFEVERDPLLAVAGIAIRGNTVIGAESYHARLDPDPATALMNLLTLCGKGPVVVYNSALNRAMLEHAFGRHLGLEADLDWIDLYWVLPGLFDHSGGRPTNLANWMKSFDIETFQRQHALGDAYAIAQLLLAAIAYAGQRGLSSAHSLSDLEQARRQLIRP